MATESGVGEATEKHGERTEPERVGSVPQISWNETNPHLEGIFYRGANPTLLSSIQTLRRIGRLRPGWLKPSNQTDRKCSDLIRLGGAAHRNVVRRVGHHAGACPFQTCSQGERSVSDRESDFVARR